MLTCLRIQDVLDDCKRDKLRIRSENQVILQPIHRYGVAWGWYVKTHVELVKHIRVCKTKELCWYKLEARGHCELETKVTWCCKLTRDHVDFIIWKRSPTNEKIWRLAGLRNLGFTRLEYKENVTMKWKGHASRVYWKCTCMCVTSFYQTVERFVGSFIRENYTRKENKE